MDANFAGRPAPDSAVQAGRRRPDSEGLSWPPRTCVHSPSTHQSRGESAGHRCRRGTATRPVLMNHMTSGQVGSQIAEHRETSQGPAYTRARCTQARDGASAVGVSSLRRCRRAQTQALSGVHTLVGAARQSARAMGLGARGTGALAATAMGGVLPALRWLPAGVRITEPLAQLRARPLDAASGRCPPGSFRLCHVSASVAGAAPGLHLSDAELWPELRWQQKPAAPLVLEGEGRVPWVPSFPSPPAAPRPETQTLVLAQEWWSRACTARGAGPGGWGRGGGLAGPHWVSWRPSRSPRKAE